MFPDLAIHPPLMNAAGCLGFAPNPRGPVDLGRLGAFVTNPVSLAPRRPAENRAMLAYPGGFLLHTGLPNPGLRAVLRQEASRWARSALPVIVHLLAALPEEVARMVERLEGVEGVMGVEIGLPPLAGPGEALALVQAAVGELPVIASLPAGRLAEIGPLLRESGVAAVSLAPERGALPGPDGRLVRGRLYGPGLLPAALSAVETAVRLGLPVIGGGGVYSPADAAAMQAAGALAVQIDTAFWRGWEN